MLMMINYDSESDSIFMFYPHTHFFYFRFFKYTYLCFKDVNVLEGKIFMFKAFAVCVCVLKVSQSIVGIGFVEVARQHSKIINI